MFGWLATKLPTYNKLPSELNLCVPLLFTCLEDRNPEVRKKTHEAVIPFMIHIGYESMARQAAKLKVYKLKARQASKLKVYKLKARQPTKLKVYNVKVIGIRY